jgi:predicted enzyme related to lactoylglutathione lyase
MIGAQPFVTLYGDPHMEAVDVRGRFVWHQLMTRDVPGAKKFYSKLVGWKTMPWPLDPAFTICHAEVGPVAGIVEIPADVPADMPSHWLQYIGTRDVDATADAAVRAGGSITKAPSDMQGAGRYAVLRDPQGASFAIIDPENARPEAQGTPPLGTFTWHELATTDHEAAFAFYSGLFGWDVMQRMDMGPIGVYLIFGQGGQQRGGMYIKPPDAPGPAFWMPYSHVASADKAHALATSSGATSLTPPMDVPGGSRVANILDPAGAAFSVHSMGTSSMAAPEAVDPAPKVKTAAAKKPAAKKKVVKKAAKKAAKKVTRKVAKKVAKKARKAAPRKKAAARKAPRKKSRVKSKSGARRKK